LKGIPLSLPATQAAQALAFGAHHQEILHLHGGRAAEHDGDEGEDGAQRQGGEAGDPWPMVQPIDSTPPKPMRIAPIRWLTKSPAEANHSMRKLREISDHSKRACDDPCQRHDAEGEQGAVKAACRVAQRLPHRLMKVKDCEASGRGGGSDRVGRRIQIPVLHVGLQ